MGLILSLSLSCVARASATLFFCVCWSKAKARVAISQQKAGVPEASLQAGRMLLGAVDKSIKLRESLCWSELIFLVNSLESVCCSVLRVTIAFCARIQPALKSYRQALSAVAGAAENRRRVHLAAAAAERRAHRDGRARPCAPLAAPATPSRRPSGCVEGISSPR